MKTTLLLGLGGAAAALLVAGTASAVTRDEVMVRARAFAVHEWASTAANQSASCKAGYKSLFPAGDYVGLPYGWGGYMTLLEFDQDIAAGYGAGAQPTDGVLACIAGVDCSGFVSMAWHTGHFTTSDLDTTSSVITTADLLPGDVFNQAGFHVAMFVNLMGGGAPGLIESVGYGVHPNTYGGWSYVMGFTPRRFSNISGTSTVVANPEGTTSNPIVIPSLPYTDSRNTASSLSSVLDGCKVASATNESGPEYVYKVDITTPGTLTVSATYDVNTDIDVELLTHLGTSFCTVRDDKSFSTTVGCGSYYIVADTYAGAAKAGPYTLNVSLAPSGAACGAVAGPPAFNPKGKLGDACAYPGHDDLGFCNPNLGAETCIYGSSSSFCSKSCAKDAECTGLGTGACCQDISGKGEFYCMTKGFCAGTSSGGTSGSSGSTGPTTKPSDGSSGGTSGDPGSGDQPGPVNVDNSGGGCSVGERSPSPWAVLLGVLGVAALRRRRR
jgi:MYXO-CTERM domain-containing protein